MPLLVCFSAVALCFATATLIAQYGGYQVQRAAQSIATNASPSQRYLGAMRNELRRLLTLSFKCRGAARTTEACRIGPPETLIRLTAAWKTYDQLPVFAGEREAWPEIEADLRDLAATAGANAQSPEYPDVLETRIESLDRRLSQLMALNLQHEDQLSGEIQALGARAAQLALLMDGVGLVFTLSMGALALRIVQRYTRRREEHLSTLSLRDELTELYNRRGLFDRAAEYVARANRQTHKLLLVFADVDYLKQINDRLGHDAGDRAILETAALLRKTFRASDILARIGGDEFVAVCPAANEEMALALKERFEGNLAVRNADPNQAFALGLSVGIAWYNPAQPEPFEALIARADAAMYGVKRRRSDPAASPSPAAGPTGSATG